MLRIRYNKVRIEMLGSSNFNIVFAKKHLEKRKFFFSKIILSWSRVNSHRWHASYLVVSIIYDSSKRNADLNINQRENNSNRESCFHRLLLNYIIHLYRSSTVIIPHTFFITCDCIFLFTLDPRCTIHRITLGYYYLSISR